MRKFAAAPVAAFALPFAMTLLAACSEKTQDNAEATLTSAGNDVDKAADAVQSAAGDAAQDIGTAAREGADAVGTAADKAGDAVERGAATVESRVQDEPVSTSKKD